MLSRRARAAAVAADRPSASRLGKPPPRQHSFMRGFPGCIARVRAHIRARRQHQQSGDRGNLGLFHSITSSARVSSRAARRRRAPPRIDHEPASGRRLHRQVPGLVALEDRRHSCSSASATIQAAATGPSASASFFAHGRRGCACARGAEPVRENRRQVMPGAGILDRTRPTTTRQPATVAARAGTPRRGSRSALSRAAHP